MLRTTRQDSARRPANPVALDATLAIACAALALWTHRRALGVYFHPDDLIAMEWSRGILPSPDVGLWRLLSGRVYFAAALGVFGTDALPYHVVNALLHMANVVLLYSLARRWGAPRAAAALTAGTFGAARPAFSVLQQAVGVGELLALGLALGAMLACEGRSTAARAAALLLFAAALLSKEAVLLLPLALLVPREKGWPSAAAWRDRLRVAAPLLVTSGAAAVTLAIGGVRERVFGGEAYAMAFGSNLFHNLMTYVSWAFDFRNPFFDDPGGISRDAWRAGVPIALVLIALAWLTRDRTRLPAIGLAWTGLGIAPVVPLIHHTYPTYLYMPLAGLALAVCTALEALPGMIWTRRRAGRDAARPGRSRANAGFATAAGVTAVIVALAVTSDRLLDVRMARRLESVDQAFDRQLRKSEMIRRAVEGLQKTGTPRRIVLYLPPEASRVVLYTSPETSSHIGQRTRVLSDTTMQIEDTLIYRVLDGGRALRALVPGLDSVAFVRRWSADYADFDLCGNSSGGDIVDFGRGPEAHLKLAELLIRGGRAPLAEDLLTSALGAYASDPRLPRMLEQARTLSRR